MCISCIPNFIQARKIVENMGKFCSNPPSKLTTDFYETRIFSDILYGIIIPNCTYRTKTILKLHKEGHICTHIQYNLH